MLRQTFAGGLDEVLAQFLPAQIARFAQPAARRTEDQPERLHLTQGLEDRQEYLHLRLATQEEIDAAGTITKTEFLSAENAEDAEQSSELHDDTPCLIFKEEARELTTKDAALYERLRQESAP